MRPTSLTLAHPSATRERLLGLGAQVPGARVGIKSAALLLLLAGQRAGWISEVLGLTRMSLCRWIHGVNAEGVEHLMPKSRPGRPAALTGRVRRELAVHLRRSPQAFGLNRVQWDGPTLVVHLKRRFGISLKVRQAQNWMHQLGYRLEFANDSDRQARAVESQRFRRALKKPESTQDE
jgi:transposase